MSNNRASKQSWNRSGTLRRWLVMLVCGAAMLPVAGGAQAPGVTATSGLHTLFAGHYLQLTAGEFGAADSTSTVMIEFRDASDQRRAFVSGTMMRGKPVRLRVAVPAGIRSEQFSVIVAITNLVNAEGSEPIVGLENIDPLSLTAEPIVVCAVDNDNPSTGSGPEGNCDGWRLKFTTQQ